jgi:hypothetical protein
MADPTHSQHATYLEWFGAHFDPAEFDLVEANARLQKVR